MPSRIVFESKALAEAAVIGVLLSTKIQTVSFRDAPLGAGPESILTIVVMDFGLARSAHDPE
jgi:hypothetical protein